MKKSSAFALPLAVAALLASVQSAPSTAFAQSSSATQPSGNTMVHFEGCLYTEKAVSSKQPATVPPVGTDTYVIINAKLISGAVSEEEVAKTAYTLEKADQEQMRSLNGKRVGVTGHVSKTDSGARIEVVDLREISGGCSTVPNMT